MYVLYVYTLLGRFISINNFVLGRLLLSRQARGGDGMLDLVDRLSGKAEDVSHAEFPPADTHRVDEEVHEKPVDDDESEEDAEAAPLVVVVHVQRVHVLPAVAVRAVAAVRRRVGVCEIAGSSDVGHEVAGILAAGLPRGRVEVRRLVRSTDNSCRGKNAREHPTKPPGHRVDIVHPIFPEDRKRIEWTDNTVEKVDHDEEEWKDL